MTRSDFKTSEKMTEFRKALEANPIIREAMEVNRNEGPVTDPVAPSISPTYANIALGMSKGFDRFYWDLLDLAKPVPDRSEPTTDYRGEEAES